MVLNYPIGDFFIRLKNAGMAGRKEIVVPQTNLIKAVAQVLKDEGFIDKIESADGNLTVSLKYKSKSPVLMDISLKSKPGLRIYMDVDEIKAQRGGSILIVSTSKGIMSSKKAVTQSVGGEVLAEIW